MADLKLKTKKFALQHLLGKAAAVVPTKDLMPVLKNFLIVATKDEELGDKVEVIATDLELSVVARGLMVDVQVPGQVVLPAKRLLEMVREAEDGEVVINVFAGEAEVQIGRTNWTLTVPDGSEYPELPDASAVKFYETDRAAFVAAIRAVRYAAATETLRHSLMMLDVTDGQMRAADGVRFQQIAVGKDFPHMQIPINAVDDLLKILSVAEAQRILLGEDENCLIFKVAGDLFIAQKLNADFPDVNTLLLKPALTNNQMLTVDRQDFVSAIKRVRITADPESSAISLELDGDSMLVRSKDKYNSSCVESVDVHWEGKPRKMAFNHAHLLDMLVMSSAKSCEFWLGEDTKTRPSPLLLRDDAVEMLGVLSQQRADWVS